MPDPSMPDAASIGREVLPAPGSCIEVEVDGQDVVLANVDDRLYALAGTCTHAECPLAEGELEGHTIICPCHGATFDLRTGEPLDGPAHLPLDVYEVVVAEQGITLRLP